MKQIEIKNRWNGKIILVGRYENIKECLEKNRDSDLSDSDLSDSDLRDSDLSGSDLSGSKGYLNSHEFFREIVRRQKVDAFTQKEWSMIGRIIVHTLCWDTIKKRFGKSAMGIFKKLKKSGFGEWFTKYSEILKCR